MIKRFGGAYISSWVWYSGGNRGDGTLRLSGTQCTGPSRRPTCLPSGGVRLRTSARFLWRSSSCRLGKQNEDFNSAENLKRIHTKNASQQTTGIHKENLTTHRFVLQLNLAAQKSPTITSFETIFLHNYVKEIGDKMKRAWWQRPGSTSGSTTMPCGQQDNGTKGQVWLYLCKLQRSRCKYRKLLFPSQNRPQ